MANILVKPSAERDGNLVILADNTSSISLVDLATGEIVETGRNTGRSNGRDSTIRFSQPGASYRNVGLMDDQGNIILTVPTAGSRTQFNYQDYNALVANPPSLIKGYKWDNTENLQAQATGAPSNADINSMSSEEYIAYLDAQTGSQGLEAQNLPAGAAVAGAAALPGIIDALGSSGATTVAAPSGPTFLPGGDAGPVVDGEMILDSGSLPSQGLMAVGDAAGTAAAIHNLGDAFGNITGGDRKGVTEGIATTAGTGLGYLFGGPLGAGIGSIAGRTVGRGINSALGALGVGGWKKGTADFHKERVAGLSPAGQDFFARADAVNAENEGVWQEGPFKGEKWTFEKATELAKKDPTHFIGNMGNFETFGSDTWVNTGINKQKEVVKRLVDEGLYTADMGDVIISGKDQERAREIFDEVTKGSQEPTGGSEQLNVIGPSVTPDTTGINTRGLVATSEEDAASPVQFVTGDAGGGVDQDKLLAYQLFGSAPSSAYTSQLVGQAFAAPQSRGLGQQGFSNLAQVFG